MQGYTIYQEIWEDDAVKVFRGILGRRTVMIKLIKKEAANLTEAARLIHEYKIIRQLNVPGVVKPVTLEYTENLALIMEDVDAVPIGQHLAAVGRLDTGAFLRVAIQLANILGQLHQMGIVVRTLTLDNILFAQESGKVYLFNLSDAVCGADSGYAVTKQADAYTAPEQCGQIVSRAEQRSDLYALGVILYRLLTGRLPLQAESPAQWTRAHLTQIPRPPRAVQPGVPPVLSDIIMKLLAKAVEERYQSAWGLEADLARCSSELARGGKAEFPIGVADKHACFQLPRGLFGRETEIEALRAAYERASAGAVEMVLIGGYPGVGKTSLVLEGLLPGIGSESFFLKGKADQLRRNIPYAPLAAAFGNLLKMLLTRSPEELESWKKQLSQALGRNGAVIADIIPELEKVMGKQPFRDGLSPKEAENRLFMAFRDFVQVFARPNKPLVVFVDDLHWADPATFRLIRYLAGAARLSHLLVIGAYRDNEIAPEQILQQFAGPVLHLSLAPLSRRHAGQLVEAVVGPDIPSTDLANVLFRQSGGNPFFLKQLLNMLYQQGSLRFDAEAGAWKWDIEVISAIKPGADVLELFVQKLQRLPEETRATLEWAACMGNTFSLTALARVRGKSEEEILSALMPAILQGLILESGSGPTADGTYVFLHDRVQQAVCASIPAEEEKRKHLAIGRSLLQGADDVNEVIIAAMDHFNRCLDLITAVQERTELARYNLQAGRRAKAAVAYDVALANFQAGQALLHPLAWETDYRLTFDIHLELAQAQYLTGQAEAAEELFDTVLARAGSRLDRADIYAIKVILYAGAGKYDKAIQTGINALAKLGVKIPRNPSMLDYAWELLLSRWHMRNKKIEDLLTLPEPDDPAQGKVAELFSRLCTVTLAANSDLFSYVIIKAGNHSARHGNTEMCSMGYLGYAITAGSVLGDYRAGERFGQVSLALLDKYPRSTYRCLINFVYGCFIVHWTNNAAIALKYFRRAIAHSGAVGNVMVMGYAHCMILEVSYLLGKPLAKVAEILEEKKEVAKAIGHDNLAINSVLYSHVLAALRGQTEFAEALAELRRDEYRELMAKDQCALATAYILETQLCYLDGRYAEALAAARKVKSLAGAIMGFLNSVEYNLYYSLAIMECLPGLPPADRRYYRRQLARNLAQMKKWARSCPGNFAHKYLLLAAESARLKKQRGKAMTLYQLAADAARRSGCLPNEALANLLAGRFYARQGLAKLARPYLRDASRCFTRWGAPVLAKRIYRQYSDILGSPDAGHHDLAEVLQKIFEGNGHNGQAAPDPAAVYWNEVVEQVAGQPGDGLQLTELLTLAVKGFNADTGYILFEKDDDLWVEAAMTPGSGEAAMQAMPLDQVQGIARGVARYVARTLETVVVNGDDPASLFANDPHLAGSGLRSIAAVPLIYKGIPVGVLYLENSRMSGVFSARSREALKILAVQLASTGALQRHVEGTAGNAADACLAEPLTARETEVLELIARGMSNKEIADQLGITLNTVKGYIKIIYDKLGEHRRVQVVDKARELKII